MALETKTMCIIGPRDRNQIHNWHLKGFEFDTPALTPVVGWVVYSPENGYNFPYPHLLRVSVLTIPVYLDIVMLSGQNGKIDVFKELTPRSQAYELRGQEEEEEEEKKKHIQNQRQTNTLHCSTKTISKSVSWPLNMIIFAMSHWKYLSYISDSLKICKLYQRLTENTKLYQQLTENT